MLALILAAVSLVQVASPQPVHDPDIAIVLSVSRAVAANRVDAAALRASTDSATLRFAFDEALADATMARLDDQPAAYPGSDRVVSALAEAVGDAQARSLAGKAAVVSRGSNPFSADAAGIEGALSAYCAIAAGDADDPAASLAERRRAEAALVAARGSRSSVLTCGCLAWLGTYAFQGGDMTIARRFLTEAVTLADTAALERARVALRRTVAATRVLDGDLKPALEDLESALAVLETRSLPDDAVSAMTIEVSTDAIAAAEKLGDRSRAVRVAERAIALLEATGAAVAVRADATERLAQLHAKGASGSRDEARRAAAAFDAVAKRRIEAGEKDRAAITLTAAGVLLLENASPAEARAVFNRAVNLTVETRNENLRAGVEYWLGRSHLADGDAKSTERAVALFTSALRRLDAVEKTGAVAPELRVRLLNWLGRARSSGSAGPTRNLAAAHAAFAKSFEVALDGGLDVNDAVVSAEQALRCRAGLGDLRLAGDEAVQFYDRLLASKRIDPLNAAAALSAELQRSAAEMGTAGVAPSVVALWDRVATSLEKEPTAPRARMLLVMVAATLRDRALLSARADAAFAGLTEAKNAADAEAMTEAVWRAWEVLGDAAAAATWRDRYATLAQASFDAATTAKRPDGAARAAEGLAAVARSRGDAVAESKWLGERDRLRREIAERYEEEGKLGQAGEAFRQLAADELARGDAAASIVWYERALKLAVRTNDPEANALALAGRAEAELASGDAASALATTSEALRLATTSAMATEGSLPSIVEVKLNRPAAVALSVRAAALEKLGRTDLASASRALAATLARP